MKPLLAELGALVLQSYRFPRAAMARLLDLPLPKGAGLVSLALVAVLYSLLLQVLHLSAPESEQGPFALLLETPFTTALTLFGIFVVSAVLIQVIGAARGGQGSLDQSFLTMAWLQVVMVIAQVVLVLLVIVISQAIPPLVAPLIGILFPGLVVLLFWLLSNFVTTLHGFRSSLRVFAGIIVSMLVVNLALSLVLSAIFGPEIVPHV